MSYNTKEIRLAYKSKYNFERSYTEKKNTKHRPSGYSIFTSYSFDPQKNKLDCYRDKDCMGRF